MILKLYHSKNCEKVNGINAKNAFFSANERSEGERKGKEEERKGERERKRKGKEKGKGEKVDVTETYTRARKIGRHPVICD